VEGAKDRPGLRFNQSGHWDDNLICQKHEEELSAADDYAARFFRRFDKAATLSDTGKSYSAPNPRPDLLLRFACATIWRFVASREGARHGLQLGPYREMFEKHLFGGASPAVQAIMGRANLVDVKGQRVEIGLPPYRRKLLEWTVWHQIAGFDFYVKTDQRPFPSSWKDFLLNDNDPVVLPLIDPVSLHSVPMLQPIFAQMRRRA
jgi:hypothetical protein